MTYTVTWRYAVADEKVGDEAVALARPVWLKHGAKSLRCLVFGSGPNIGQWIIVAEFPDGATFGRAQDAVRQSDEFKKWTAANRTAKNIAVDCTHLRERT